MDVLIFGACAIALAAGLANIYTSWRLRCLITSHFALLRAVEAGEAARKAFTNETILFMKLVQQRWTADDEWRNELAKLVGETK